MIAEIKTQKTVKYNFVQVPKFDRVLSNVKKFDRREGARKDF